MADAPTDAEILADLVARRKRSGEFWQEVYCGFVFVYVLLMLFTIFVAAASWPPDTLRPW